MTDCFVISSQEELETLISWLDEAKEFSIWLSTPNRGSLTLRINCMGIHLKEDRSFCVPIHLIDQDENINLDQDLVMRVLKPYFEEELPRITGHHVKRIIKVLWELKIELKGLFFDAKVAAYLLEPNRNDFNLSPIAKRYLNLDELSNSVQKNASLKQRCQEAARNAQLIWKLKNKLAPKLKEEGLFELFTQVEMPLIRILAQMELCGIKLDARKLSKLAKEIRQEKRNIEEEIHSLAGEEFNPNSPKQVGHILFEKLDLPVIEKTKTGPSTNSRVLKELSSKHPLPVKILKFRELSKLLNTYVEKLPEYINQKTGRVHTTFNQSVTATGRLSSSEPNLQNIPVRTEIGKKIRRAFVASAGKKLISADYSQIELRLLAHLSGDQEMIKAFQKDQDLHDKTASEIFDVELDQVDRWMRDVAKRVNFGIPYGISSYRLAKELGVCEEEAQGFIDRYYSRYPKVREFIDELIAQAKKKGYITTILNRKRPLPFINSSNYNKRRYDQRNAINTPIQGSAADLIKLAMLKIDQGIHAGELNASLLLQVHDELIFETEEKEAQLTGEKIKAQMEKIMQLAVPLKVDIKIGDNWGEI